MDLTCEDAEFAVAVGYDSGTFTTGVTEGTGLIDITRTNGAQVYGQYVEIRRQ